MAQENWIDNDPDYMEDEDEREEDWHYDEPDYKSCMCCGRSCHIRNHDCPNCSGPLTEEYF